MKEVDERHRRIALIGPLNFRDLGGYRVGRDQQVRWGRVYRSDSLWRATDDDVDHLVREIGLRTIIDLRTHEELGQFGRGALEHAAPAYHHVPLFDETQRADPSFFPEASLVEMYLTMLRDWGGQVAAVLQILSDEDTHPAVFHCAAGKDRTGIVAAVLLRLLGVEPGDVVSDYALTADILPEMYERFRAYAAEAQVDLDEQLPASVWTADGPTMEATLAAIDAEFGSVEAYASVHGVGPEVVASLQSALVEPAAG